MNEQKEFSASLINRDDEKSFRNLFLQTEENMGFEKSTLRHISRLYSEQKRLENSSIRNLSLGIGIVFIVVVYITYIFFGSGFGLGYLSSWTTAETTGFGVASQYSSSLIFDCYPREQRDGNTSFKQLKNDDEINHRLECIKNAIPVEMAINNTNKSENPYRIPRGFFDQLSPDSLYSMVSKLLLITLLQLVSFFFLRLYVSNQSDAKYFSNEISNAEVRLQAYIAAKETGDTKIIADFVKKISGPERNFILKKGERVIFSSETPDIKDLSTSISEMKDILKGFKS